MKRIHHAVLVATLLAVGGCATLPSQPDFSGQRRFDDARRKAESTVIWYIDNSNWNTFRITALLDGTTEFPLVVVEGNSHVTRVQRLDWTVMRLVYFRLVNTVTGETHITEPYSIGPGQKVLMDIKPSVRLTTVFPLNFSAADLARLEKS